VARRIVAPLRAVADALGPVAEGDLTDQVAVAGKDEIGQLATAANGADLEPGPGDRRRHRGAVQRHLASVPVQSRGTDASGFDLAKFGRF
jgi:hypothetical protein